MPSDFKKVSREHFISVLEETFVQDENVPQDVLDAMRAILDDLE